ncbi:hypothetical protein NE236_33865 [Actinoallomurus purpureus]|uniref:hypothetical protein n=1 Tax=Actinoallomurus purpureus TaxID=478114 RepID=UPI0020933144|nr:hypothetical protein [Actinoallomurus purpureus]MCO6009971.1 hypothetical protein [Actinoallomurus purpureus]
MKNRRITRTALASLAMTAGLLATVSPAAHADPHWRCGTSTANLGHGKISMHYHNCDKWKIGKEPVNNKTLKIGGKCHYVKHGQTIAWIIKAKSTKNWTTYTCTP